MRYDGMWDVYLVMRSRCPMFCSSEDWTCGKEVSDMVCPHFDILPETSSML